MSVVPTPKVSVLIAAMDEKIGIIPISAYLKKYNIQGKAVSTPKFGCLFLGNFTRKR
jgi:hypothetical protein